MSMSDFPDPEEEMLKQLQQLSVVVEGLRQTLAQFSAAIQYLGRPKRIVRGPDGRAVGVE